MPRANSRSPRAGLPGVKGKGHWVWGRLRSWADRPQALSWCSDQGCSEGLADRAGAGASPGAGCH